MPKATRTSVMSEYEAIIRTAMARTLWVVSYADYAEENRDDRSIRRARGGQDWDEVAGPTPPMAKNAADALVERFIKSEPMSPYEYEMANLYDMARTADDGETWQWPTKPARNVVESMKEFGHYMVMQSLGHGVSWFDDHKEFGLKFPRFECGYDGTNLWWSGMAMGNPASSKPLAKGTRVNITAPDDDSDVIGTGVVKYFKGGEYGIQLDGERRVDLYAPAQVFPAERGNPAAEWMAVAVLSADRSRDPDAMSSDLAHDVERTFKVVTMREATYPLWRVLVKAEPKTIAKIRTYALAWLANEGVAATRPNPRQRNHQK